MSRRPSADAPRDGSTKAARLFSNENPIQAMYAAPASSTALKAAGTSCRMATMPSAPIATWQTPPAMMPAVAANPARRPSTSELASTNAMSSPGSRMTPKTMRKNNQR